MIVEEIVHCGRRYAYIHYSETWDVYFLKWELKSHGKNRVTKRALERLDRWNHK